MNGWKIKSGGEKEQTYLRTQNRTHLVENLDPPGLETINVPRANKSNNLENLEEINVG
jgi:hypothetical protein